MNKTMLGIFNQRMDVEEAINLLQKEGFDPKDISIVMKNSGQANEIGQDTGANVAGGVVSGATTGAVVGGVAGFLAGTVFPVLGGFLIGGPIGAALGLTGAAATTVSGAATGAVAGGLIGALTGMGVSKDEAEQYETKIKKGAILLAVPVQEDEEARVSEIFTQYHASDMQSVNQSSQTARNTMNNQGNDSPSQVYQFASSGAKGGEVGSAKKGWHGDSEDHSQASKGIKTHEDN